MLDVRDSLKLDIGLFSMHGTFAVPFYQPNRTKFDDKLNVLTDSPDNLEKPRIICNSKLIEPLQICSRRSDCRYQSNKTSNFKRHSAEICDSNAKTQIVCQQQMFGAEKSLINELIHLNYLPAEANNYVCSAYAAYDIVRV